MFAIRSGIIFLLLWCSLANANSTWRCSGGLVSAGNTVSEVLARCGKPDERNSLGYGRRVVDYGWYQGFEDVKLEEWVYSVRSNLYYVLKFEGGELQEITSHFQQ